jgi:epoxyqueuosine reductase
MAGMSVEQEIKDKTGELGFDAVGITDVSRIGSEHVEHLEAWLQSGCAGRMEYMYRNVDKRIDPARLRKGAQSVIVVALNYKPRETSAECGTLKNAEFEMRHGESDELVGTAHPTDSAFAIPHSEIDPTGRVAMYAQYEDYHLFIKDRLRELAGFICVRTGQQDRFKVCVDSAPVAEKALAVRAGLGFIGKNHLLIHPQLGPQVLLGELFTSVPLESDEPGEGACRDCDRCIKACPTGALRPDGLLDATRCISYLTQYEPREEEWNDGMMEHRTNTINSTAYSTTSPFHDSNPLRNWLFGCDECLLACPFHLQAPSCANRHFRHYPQKARLNLRQVLGLTAEAFERQFRDSPIKRLGLEALQRNARICLPAR